MKNITIILIFVISFFISSCGDSTVYEQKDKVKFGELKYTLEEILADTNWVEITDTLHLNDIGYFPFNSMEWKEESFKFITNIEEYQKLKIVKDTNYFGGKPIELKQIDLINYDLIGYFIAKGRSNNKNRYFKNIKTKEVFYYIELFQYFDEMLRTSQNWLLVPKIPNDYKITYNVKILLKE